MFLNKIQGAEHRKSFSEMYGLQLRDVAFLLENISISSFFMDVFCHPRLFVCTDVRTLIYK